MIKYLLAAGTGAALAYFLDPDRGKRRRNMARDRLTATMRRASERVEHQARYAASTAQGLQQKAEHMSQQQGAPSTLNDFDLAHKVETELFRDPNVPKGKININAESGVVVLRGEVGHPDEINTIERRVRDIPGVAGVENLLHLPDTPAHMS
jgi:osmotically-inducible protein OsmY